MVPRPAATVVLVRTGRDGIEVLLTRRPDTMAFAAGLHVFPGGRVETGDGDPRLVARARGPQDDPAFGVAHRIAAIRETWEEVGVLLADGPASGTAVGVGRDRSASFAELVEVSALELRTDELVEVARWTTPRAFPRRFDTRFFVAAVPAGVTLDPDPAEVVALDWFSPRAALAAMASGRIEMWPPTSTTLQRLERAVSFDEIRVGLARAPEPTIGISRISAELRILTGQSAFGPTGRPANTVLVGRAAVVVIDPGDPGEAFVDAIETEVAATGGRIAAIGLTHVDPGHAAGSEELQARTDAPLLVGPGGAASLSWAATEISDGDLVGIGDGSVRAIATPGHRPDHLAFLTRDGTLVTGDALSERLPFIRPPEGDLAAQRRSLDRIAGLLADGAARRVVPGHGPAVLPDAAGALAAAIRGVRLDDPSRSLD